MSKRIHVIVNPAAGEDRPILSIFNRTFTEAGLDWDVFVTKRAGDGCRLARQSVESGADVVAVYGGDGTVMEVGSALIGTDVPLGIFPGGTANIISRDLRIPSDLAEAFALVCGPPYEVRAIDVGRIGDRYFLIRAGLGLEAEMIEGADRGLKDKLGNLAYGVAAIKALGDTERSRYRLRLDGDEVEIDGVTCLITNAGRVGQADLSLAPGIAVDDGLLDVIVLRRKSLPALVSAAASLVAGKDDAEPLQHWQVRSVSVTADPPQAAQVDGEVVDLQSLDAQVLPAALKVIVPCDTSKG